MISREHVTPAALAKEKEIAADQVKNKPPQAISKIVEGKIEKYYQTICLVDQGFVKRNSEVSVKEHIGGIAKQLGDEIVIRRFARFQESARRHQQRLNYLSGSRDEALLCVTPHQSYSLPTRFRRNSGCVTLSGSAHSRPSSCSAEVSIHFADQVLEGFATTSGWSAATSVFSLMSLSRL